MNKKRSVKLIKSGQREDPKIRRAVESAVGPNRWSKAVRGWVGEFQAQQPQRGAILPAFDSLFKDIES